MTQVLFAAVFLVIFAATAGVTIAGLAGWIEVPTKYDKHFHKLVNGLLIEVAVAVIAAFASFNWGAGTDSPVDPERLGELISPPLTTWIPLGRDTGLPVDLSIRPGNSALLAVPDSHGFGGDLALVPDSTRKGRFAVIHERRPEYQFGTLSTDDFSDSELIDRVETRVDVTIRRVTLNDPLADGSFPFEISLYKRGTTLRFKLTAADTVVVDRPADKELHRVLPIAGSWFLVAVVLSVPNPVSSNNGSLVPPFAEFAIGRIAPTWSYQ